MLWSVSVIFCSGLSICYILFWSVYMLYSVLVCLNVILCSGLFLLYSVLVCLSVIFCSVLSFWYILSLLCSMLCSVSAMFWSVSILYSVLCSLFIIFFSGMFYLYVMFRLSHLWVYLWSCTFSSFKPLSIYLYELYPFSLCTFQFFRSLSLIFGLGRQPDRTYLKHFSHSHFLHFLLEQLSLMGHHCFFLAYLTTYLPTYLPTYLMSRHQHVQGVRITSSLVVKHPLTPYLWSIL